MATPTTIEDTRDSFNATVADLCRDLDGFLRSDAAAPYVIPKKKQLTHFQRSVVELAEAIAEMPATLLPPTAATVAATAATTATGAPVESASTDAIAKSDVTPQQDEQDAKPVAAAATDSKAEDEAEAAEEEAEDDPEGAWVWYARQALRALFISMPAPLTAALPASIFAAHETLLKEELECAEEDGEVPDVERDFRPLLSGSCEEGEASASAASGGAAYPIVVWRGDMSRLRVDAMVNPANAALMGCFLPAHKCLDNILHAQAGIRLRAECHAMFAREGIDPKTGDANGRCRVTPACALPATWVFHTIGPDLNEVVKGKHHLRAPTDVDRAELASCYSECYRAAMRLGARSLAFCCISTGVFGYPQVEAARIALQTVKDEMDAAAAANAPCRPLVVFNVFAPADLTIYSSLVKEVFSGATVPVIGGGAVKK